MIEENKQKLLKIIKDNNKWPILIEGEALKNFPKATFLSAKILSAELGIGYDENGCKFPTWLESVKTLGEKYKHTFLIITDLDKVSMGEQEKFYGILKHSGVNGYKFPSGTQILLTIKNGNKEKISPKLLSLMISYKVE